MAITAIYRQEVAFSATGGSKDLVSSTVGEGVVRVLTHIGMYNEDAGITPANLRVTDEVTLTRVGYIAGASSQVGIEWDGEIYLDAGCYVLASFGSSGAGEKLRLDLQGWEMEAP